MALIICPECGKLISDRAKECPQCGTSIEKIQELLKEATKNDVAEQNLQLEEKNSTSFELVNVIISIIIVFAVMLCVYFLRKYFLTY